MALTILHSSVPHPSPLLDQHPYPSWITPILRMHLSRLKYCIQSQQLHRIYNFPCKWVVHRQFLPHSSAFGSRAIGIEVEWIKALVALMAIIIRGGWSAKLWLQLRGGYGGSVGFGDRGGADD